MKELVRIVSKAVSGVAVLVFLLAPFTTGGLMLMAIAVLVGLVCFAGYLWSEPDVPPYSEDSD